MTSTAAPARKAPFDVRRLLHAREAGVFAALVLLFILGAVLSPNFIGSGNLLLVGQQISQIGIMAIGATFVIVTTCHGSSGSKPSPQLFPDTANRK